MFRTSAAALLAFLGVLAAPAYAQVKLEWKFKEGDKFYQESVTRMKQDMTFTILGNPQSMNQEMKQTTVLSFTVQKITPDGVEIEQRFESLDMDASGPASQAASFVEQIEGSTLRVTLNAKNQVAKLEGVDELIKKVVGDDPVLRQMLQSTMGEDAMKKQVEESFAFLPENPVSVGDKWERKSTVPLGPLGSFNTTQTFTYAGRDNLGGKSVEKLISTAKMTFVPPKANQGPFPFQINKGDFKSDRFDATYFFDADAGRLVQAEVKMKFKGTLSIVAGGQNADMEMDQDSTITIRVLDKNPAAN